MQIVERSIDDIREYNKNPRKNDDAAEKVAESIKEFGFKVPIIIDKDGVIIAGHTRIKAARLLGLTVVPCVVADDLTEDEVKAFRLADNKVGEIAEWDYSRLEEEQEKIISIDLETFGFDMESHGDGSEFFEDAEPKEKESKMVQCPHCGGWNEV